MAALRYRRKIRVGPTFVVQAATTKNDRPSFLGKTYRELRLWATALIGAGLLSWFAPYLLPDHEPMEKRCEVAYNLHAAFYAKPPTAALEKKLSDRADADLAECLK